MKVSCVTASAPGSLMLFGEHAVLANKKAIVAAHGKRLSVTLTPGGDHFCAVSEAYGQIDLEAPDPPPTFAFVKAAFDLVRPLLKVPVTLHIASDFSGDLGFGSSAAVTVAVLGAFWGLCHPGASLTDDGLHTLWGQSLSVIRHVQGLGSGADAAASLWGGVILCDPALRSITRITDTLPLLAVYSGAKRKTAEVVQEMQDRMRPFGAVQEALFEASEAITKAAVVALRQGNIQQVGQLANMAQGLMASYGVNTPVLQQLADQLRVDAGCDGAKISGSGLGDCVIGIGGKEEERLGEKALHLDALFAPYPVFPLQVAQKGLELASL